jgi:hypothetical protein
MWLHRGIIAYRKQFCTVLLFALLFAGCGGAAGTDQTSPRPEVPRGGDNVQP